MTKSATFILLIFVLLPFFVGANTKPYNIVHKEPEIIGIIIKTKKSPTNEQITKLKQAIETSDLKFSKKISRFNLLIFNYKVKKGDLSEVEHLCNQVTLYSFVSRCEADWRSVPNQSKETEGNICVNCAPQKPIQPEAIRPITDVINKCDLLKENPAVESFDGKLTDYWAQEYIGADLLRELLILLKIKLPDNFLAVFDSAAADHYSFVRSLISDNKDSGILPYRSDEVTMYPISSESSYADLASKLINNPPRFINISMGWGSSQTSKEALSALANKSIIVTCAHNWAIPVFEIHPYKAELGQENKVIIVGSYSPFGIPSEFTNYGKEVNLSAPSDHYILSDNELFGGTSGHPTTE